MKAPHDATRTRSLDLSLLVACILLWGGSVAMCWTLSTTHASLRSAVPTPHWLSLAIR